MFINDFYFHVKNVKFLGQVRSWAQYVRQFARSILMARHRVLNDEIELDLI